MVSSTRESDMKHFLKKGKDFSFSTQKLKLSHTVEEILHIASNLPQTHSLEDHPPCKAKVYCRMLKKQFVSLKNQVTNPDLMMYTCC
jgi:hypothetical protein